MGCWCSLTKKLQIHTDLPVNSSFSDNLFYEIPRQTNKNARETIASLRARNHLPPNWQFRSWPDDSVTAGDIKAFLALSITMGFVTQENIQDHQSTDKVLLTPFFLQTMARDKFLNILTFLHLRDNDS